jgi:cobalt-zinc-cadmium efflux system protein
VAGIILMITHLTFVDPLLSLLIAVLIAFGAVRILRQTIIILLEGTPVGIDFQKVVQAIQTVPCVEDVHDVHLWSIASGRNALSCHIVLDGRLTIQESQGVLRAIEHTLIHMGIAHVTIQTEDSGHPHEAKALCQGHEDTLPNEEHHHHEGEISH